MKNLINKFTYKDIVDIWSKIQRSTNQNVRDLVRQEIGLHHLSSKAYFLDSSNPVIMHIRGLFDEE